MSEMDIAQQARQIAQENGVELDFEELDSLREVQKRAGEKWHAETIAILKEKNKPLLDKLTFLEQHIDSLILLPYKPAALKKDFKAKLEEYEKTIDMCVDYASRHITKQGGS